jgi:hypothetical protein
MDSEINKMRQQKITTVMLGGAAVMRYVTVLVGGLLFATPLLAETPCDFKGITVGDKMPPAKIMAALGVTEYKMNPILGAKTMALIEKYGFRAAGELADWEIGPYCNSATCTVPYGVAVGDNNNIPATVEVSFHEHLITKIAVSFSQTYWDEKLTAFGQRYGLNWTRERSDIPITNYETKETITVPRIVLQTKGTNVKTKDHCKISATNFDNMFEHHDTLGPYHSRVVIQLIPKDF